MKQVVLYWVTILIWGSTWIAIKFQLGHVDPMASVVLFGVCKVRGLPLVFFAGTLFYGTFRRLVFDHEGHEDVHSSCPPCSSVRQDKPGHSNNLQGGYHVNC